MLWVAYEAFSQDLELLSLMYEFVERFSSAAMKLYAKFCLGFSTRDWFFFKVSPKIFNKASILHKQLGTVNPTITWAIF